MTLSADILIIDDEEAICFAFKRYFESRGARVEVASSAADGLARYRDKQPDVTFLDVRLPDRNGLEVLDELRRDDPDACIVVMTAYGSLKTVTRAVNGKAFDYLVKPLDLKRAGELVEQAVASRRAPQRAAAGEARASGDIVCASAAMQEVFKRVIQVAQVDSAILISGQTGTGKEVVARAVHDHSRRKAGPFVAVNCGALPENLVESELFGYVRGAFSGADSDKPGRFESADGGTLFLDEVGELSLAAQVKLLRFLDSQMVERLGSLRGRQVDVRIVAATNRDLTRALEEGVFRRDLYYRLAVVEIALPPLRERVDDILPLAQHFLACMEDSRSTARTISAQAAERLQRYPWPGNVRELRNAVEHAAAVCAGTTILPAHLPHAVQNGLPAATAANDAQDLLDRYIQTIQAPGGQLYRSAVEPLEKALIRHALQETGGNQSAAAEKLGLHRNTLRTKIREFGLEPEGGQ